jgi:hypothetical protein
MAKLVEQFPSREKIETEVDRLSTEEIRSLAIYYADSMRDMLTELRAIKNSLNDIKKELKKK